MARANRSILALDKLQILHQLTQQEAVMVRNRPRSTNSS